MNKTATRLFILVLAAGIGTNAVQASQLLKRSDLPILVDKHHAIKDPAGPVTAGPLVLDQQLSKAQIRKLTETPLSMPAEQQLMPEGF